MKRIVASLTLSITLFACFASYWLIHYCIHGNIPTVATFMIGGARYALDYPISRATDAFFVLVFGAVFYFTGNDSEKTTAASSGRSLRLS